MEEDATTSVGRPASRTDFDAFFDAHYPEVLAFALRRLGDRSGADEAAAETFAVAWRRREELSDIGLPWLYGVAANVIRNNRRSSRRLLRLRARMRDERVEPGRDPAEAIAERSAIAFAFSQLSEAQREVLRLVNWEGLSSVEAAEALGCSRGALRVRLHRARRDLAKHLEAAGHEGVEEPPQMTTPITKEMR